MLKLEFGLDLSNMYILALLLFILVLFIAVDVFYFIRVAGTYVYGKYFQREVTIDDTTEIYGLCTTNDLDLFFNNMNNARYVREADFGRFHYYQRSGLLRFFKNGTVLQGACSIRYRKPISFLNTYRVTTKVVYWDDKNIYFEQRFITGDGFVRAVMLSQNKAINMDAAELMSKRHGQEVAYRPELPEELKLWIASMELSSNQLRKKD